MPATPPIKKYCKKKREIEYDQNFSFNDQSIGNIEDS